MNTLQSIHSMKSQQGFVLIVSILILMVVTMLGVTGLSTATLEGRMAHNLQHNMFAFQSAESIIKDTIMIGEPNDTTYSSATDPYLLAYDSGAAVNINPDMATYQAAISGGVATISTAGSTVTQTSIIGANCGDFDVDKFICVPFEINAVATIDTSNATVNNIQGVDRIISKPD